MAKTAPPSLRPSSSAVEYSDRLQLGLFMSRAYRTLLKDSEQMAAQKG